MFNYLFVALLMVFSPVAFADICSPSPFVEPLGCAEFCYQGTPGMMPTGELNGVTYDLSAACAGVIGPDCYGGSCSVPYQPPPVLPFLEGAVAAALALAAGLAAGALAIAAAPVMAVSGAAATAILFAIGAALSFPGGGSDPAATPQAAADEAPIYVRLEPSPSPAAAPSPGDDKTPTVVTNPNGAFVPGAGGSDDGSGGGGWTPGTSPGDWAYTPPSTPENPTPGPTVQITGGGGAVGQQVDPQPDGTANQTVVITKASGGEIVFQTSAVIPVTSAAGDSTTVTAYSTTVYSSVTGGVVSNTVSVSPTLGNGSSSAGGFTPVYGGGGGGGGSPTCPAGFVYVINPAGCALADGGGDMSCPPGYYFDIGESRCLAAGGDGDGDGGFCETGDCATETTQLANKGLLQQIKDFFTGGSDTTPADGEAPTTEAIASAGIGTDDFAQLLSWRLPAHSSSCPTSSFSFSGTNYVFDAHCPLITDHFGAFRGVMVALFTVAALFIVLRA